MLLDVFEEWPKGAEAEFLITPGAFLYADTPSGLSGFRSWKSRSDDFLILVDAASSVVSRLISPKLTRVASGKCKYLTVGIDFGSEDRSDAELIAVVDLATGDVVGWTGKSYPSSGQERDLIQVVDLKSHFMTLGQHRVLILGCHDLNMFSARARANLGPSGPRRRRSDSMLDLATKFQPTVVLQHPHYTDSPLIWRTAWAGIRDGLGVQVWASAICFHKPNDRPRRSLADVLTATRSEQGRTLDFVFRIDRRARAYRENLKKFRPAI
jgi:hypothetical protein